MIVMTIEEWVALIFWCLIALAALTGEVIQRYRR